MDFGRVITQLRQYAPIFGTRVAGAADFAKGVEDTAQMDMPAAYVIPLGEDASENLDMTGLRQNVIERFSIIVAFDNTGDRRGQGVTVLYDTVRDQIYGALLNWRIDPHNATKGIYSGGAQLRDWNRARLWYEWHFALDVIITDEDGWQEPNVPLTVIKILPVPGLGILPNGPLHFCVGDVVLPLIVTAAVTVGPPSVSAAVLVAGDNTQTNAILYL
ncbi:MAG: hypothetical protein NVSMB20_10400 [Bradyrhizobium sp.]